MQRPSGGRLVPQRAVADVEGFANETGEQRSGHGQHRNEIPDHDKPHSIRLFDCWFVVFISMSISVSILGEFRRSIRR